MKARSSEKGQALILIVFAIVGMIGMTALAVDGGMAYIDHRQAQNTADASALAGALSLVRGGDWHTIGLNSASANGFTNSGDTTVDVNNPPSASCDGANNPYTGNDEYVQVVIHSVSHTYFGPVIGITAIHNCVEAIARAKPGTTSPMVYGNALVSLAKNGSKTFWTHGNPHITTINSGIFVNSSTDCGFTSNGVPTISTPSISIVGSVSCPQMSGTVSYGVSQVPYPPMVLPNPTCTGNAVQNGTVLSPGIVNGDFPPKSHGVQVTDLESGIYCVTGNFMLNGNDTLNGTDIVIVMESGGVTLNGNGTLNLSAPTAGPFAGLLIYLPMSNNSVVKINGNSGQHFTGSILAPASEIMLDGTADTNAYHSQIIGYTVDIAGTFNGTITYDDSQNYDAAIPPQVELTR